MMATRSRVAAVCVLMLALTVVPVWASAAGGPPVVTVASPADYASLPFAPVSVAGWASASTGVASVTVTINNIDTGATNTYRASLSHAGASFTDWNVTGPPQTGSFQLKVVAADVTGQMSSPVTGRFDVASLSALAFLTLDFSRSQMAIADNQCQALPGAFSLNRVADALAAMHIPIVGSVVTSYIGDTGAGCVAHGIVHDLYPTWSQLATFRDADRMTFISAGIDYLNNTSLTPPQLLANVCGSLLPLAAHGHTRAWGMYSYPNNKYTTSIQVGVTSNCFAYGRTYGANRNTDSIIQQSPWFERTFAPLGGACNNPKAPCYSLKVIGPETGRLTRYFAVPDLERLMQVGAGEWSVVQLYKMVTGSYRAGSTTGISWDCTSPNWQDHYVTDTETYCWKDLLRVVSVIPPGVIVTDPATVAQQLSPNPTPPIMKITSAPPPKTSSTAATFGFTATETRAWFSCTLDAGQAQACSSPTTYTGLQPGGHNIVVQAMDASGNTGAPVSWKWTVIW